MNSRKNILTLAALTVSALLTFTGCQSTQGGHDHSKHSHGSAAKSYPLKTCAVTDEALDKDAHSFVHNGQEIKACCEGCRDDFNKEPAKYLKKLSSK